MNAALAQVDNNIIESGQVMNEQQILDKFADILEIDVANGDAREDTLRAYASNMKMFVQWYKDQGFNINEIREWHIKKYRQFMINEGLAHATQSLKLTTLRRFFKGLKDRDIIERNPAANVKPPRDREAKTDIKYLSPGEVELLSRELKQVNGVKGARDRAMIALMLREGLRAVEVVRANVADIDERDNKILIHGKGKDAYIYPSQDTLDKINEYLELRKEPDTDEQGLPLFVNLDRRTGGRRLTRPGLRSVVNKYFKMADIKVKGLSCHALRHTCGKSLYEKTKDVRVVQEVLRHSDPSTAAKYAHITERKEARYTEDIEITF